MPLYVNSHDVGDVEEAKEPLKSVGWVAPTFAWTAHADQIRSAQLSAAPTHHSEDASTDETPWEPTSGVRSAGQLVSQPVVRPGTRQWDKLRAGE